MIKKIFIVGGHGYSSRKRNDVGAVAHDGTTERSVILGIAKNMQSLIGEDTNFEFIGVDKKMTVAQKTAAVNAICKKEKLTWKNSLLVSLHADWRGASEGVSGYYYRGSDESKEFLKAVQDQLSKDSDRKVLWSRPDTSSRFKTLGIVKNTKPLACLLEVGSLRADDDQSDGLELLKSKAGQLMIAKSIVVGLKLFAWHELPKAIEIVPEAAKMDNQEAIDEAIEMLKGTWNELENQKSFIERTQQEVHDIANVLRGE